jgi:hypothetical protein
VTNGSVKQKVTERNITNCEEHTVKMSKIKEICPYSCMKQTTGHGPSIYSQQRCHQSIERHTKQVRTRNKKITEFKDKPHVRQIKKQQNKKYGHV